MYPWDHAKQSIPSIKVSLSQQEQLYQPNYPWPPHGVPHSLAGYPPPPPLRPPPPPLPPASQASEQPCHSQAAFYFQQPNPPPPPPPPPHVQDTEQPYHHSQAAVYYQQSSVAVPPPPLPSTQAAVSWPTHGPVMFEPVSSVELLHNMLSDGQTADPDPLTDERESVVASSEQKGHMTAQLPPPPSPSPSLPPPPVSEFQLMVDNFTSQHSNLFKHLYSITSGEGRSGEGDGGVEHIQGSVNHCKLHIGVCTCVCVCVFVHVLYLFCMCRLVARYTRATRVPHGC